MPAGTPPKYKRVLLKLSGESFARPGDSGISLSEVQIICEQVKRVVDSGVQLAIVEAEQPAVERVELLMEPDQRAAGPPR